MGIVVWKMQFLKANRAKMGRLAIRLQRKLIDVKG